MFIREPYQDNIELIRNDEYLDYENFDNPVEDLRIMPPNFPPPGSGPSQPPRPPRPPRPPFPGPGPVQPPRPPRPPVLGPGPVIPPRPPRPPRPPFPGPGPGPVIPPFPTIPSGPPPTIVPPFPLVDGEKVTFNSIRNCIYHYTYIWIINGNSFWTWPTAIDRRTLTGYRWNGYRWLFFTINLNRIFASVCYGRTVERKDDNIIPYLKTQTISPQNFKLEYPYIEGSDNENVENLINEELISEFNSLLLNEVLVPTSANFSTITSAYETPLDSDGILSIVMSIYTKMTKEERGRSTFTAITLNINTGQVYSFDDLFDSSTDYRKIISDIAVKNAQKQNLKFIIPYTGVTDNQKFYLTPVEIVLFYQVDEFTNYQEGLFRISIPYTDLRNILAYNSPIKKLIQ